jgi:large subunit ribosomal protein L17
MRHQISGRGFSRSGSHRKAMYRNLVTDLLKHEKITTTEAKAKEIRPLAEQMITLGKKGGLHSYRQALTFIYDEDVARKVFSDLAKRYAERPGGYTRIVKLGTRLGDAAPVVMLELVV